MIIEYIDKCNEKFKYVIGYHFSSYEKGEYGSDNIDELLKYIKNSQVIQTWLKETLTYGYFGEFFNVDKMYTQEYTIDNCLHFYWYIKDENGNLKYK